MSRRDEIRNVKEGQEPTWLAGQIDEIEIMFITKLDLLSGELAALRKVLLGILIAIVVALVSIPVGIIWAAATAGK